ncbi:hypothetical protein D8674_019647 [Pyrus ussuriensis x Pyrus communis]|uniref:DUF7787 domain-containing protein n=1 Tax=Pyrus ussuriensis x Pyrus communis TaxID=2448454 RepID=A0A5N5G854_9ROSA|nr:hypothetical protein D8674_019647 [Pyrus ussuriensis x Pyrus communis]
MDMVSESASASASSSASKRKTTSFHSEKMTLEDYLLLIQSNSHLHLTVAHLNQIISMHGYKKIYKVPKARLSDAVSSLPLVDPARSTLKDYISPFVITTLEDVVADLADLNWKECCVTSVETLSSWKHTTSAPAPPVSPSHDVVQYLQPQQSPPLALDCRPYGVVSAPNSASGTAHPEKKLVTKRKRKRSPVAAGFARAALDSVSYGSC